LPDVEDGMIAKRSSQRPSACFAGLRTSPGPPSLIEQGMQINVVAP
jgi:hypothetical protein